MAEIMYISDVLKMDLNIPNFQRPYKWQNKNVLDLLEDIKVAIQDSKKFEGCNCQYKNVVLWRSKM